jgi:hypothetical protein
MRNAAVSAEFDLLTMRAHQSGKLLSPSRIKILLNAHERRDDAGRSDRERREPGAGRCESDRATAEGRLAERRVLHVNAVLPRLNRRNRSRPIPCMKNFR